MGIERFEHVIDHPEDGLTAAGLAEEITLRCTVHLLDSEFTGRDEGLKKIEVISTAGINHLHRGENEVKRVARIIRIEWLALQVAIDHLNVEAEFKAYSL